MWLVIGYGNALRGDDGAGIAVAERLRALADPARCAVATVHQLMPEWAEPISRAEGVVFVDADAGLAAGSVRCVALSAAPSGAAPAFTHHCTPQSLLGAAGVLYGHDPPGWLVTVGAACFDLCEALSPPVQDAVPRAVALVQQLLGATDGRPSVH